MLVKLICYGYIAFYLGCLVGIFLSPFDKGFAQNCANIVNENFFDVILALTTLHYLYRFEDIENELKKIKSNGQKSQSPENNVISN